jgi:shikimate 5-dehydrogenase
MERTRQMKIGVIGAGAVGSACLLSSILRGIAREIVVVNRERKRAKAVVTDLQYGAALSSVVQIRDGDYSDLTGAAAIRQAGSSCSSRTLVSTGKSFPRSSRRYRKRSSWS